MKSKRKKKVVEPKVEPKKIVKLPIGRIALIACGLVILTLSVFSRTPRFDFVNLDDNVYVSDNPLVMSGLTSDSVGEAFKTFWQLNWHPLTWISLMTDTQITKWAVANDIAIGNERAGVYHLTNLILHLSSVVILFLLLSTLTGHMWRSAFVAALFGIHPMHVESVAWVAERKDVLSTLFWFTTMLVYVRYTRRPSVARYVPIIVLYALGLMSKPMLVTLPIVLLLIDLWPLRRLEFASGKAWRQARGLLLEKIPLFAMSAGSCVVTVVAQRSGHGIVPFHLLPISIRAANAVVSGVEYVLKMLWPSRLACMYPHPLDTIPTWMVPTAAIALAAMTFFAIRQARSRPYVTAGWLWYLITLLPVCGLIQVGQQQMADRYSYIPFVGLFMLIAWMAPELTHMRRLVAGLAVVVVAASAVVTYKQVGYWEDSVTLMTHAIEVTERNSVAENNLGQALSERQDIEGALVHVKQALIYRGDYIDAIFNLGTLYMMERKFDKAEPVFEKLLYLKPDHSGAHNNLARIMISKQDIDGAIEHFRTAVECDPRNEKAVINLDRAIAMKEAIMHQLRAGNPNQTP